MLLYLSGVFRSRLEISYIQSTTAFRIALKNNLFKTYYVW